MSGRNLKKPLRKHVWIDHVKYHFEKEIAENDGKMPCYVFLPMKNVIGTQNLYYKYINIDDYGKLPCYVCGNELIDSWDFECGHINSVANGGGNNRNNLRAICSLCNKSMQKENLYVYKSKLIGQNFYDDNRMTEIKKSIIDYYKYTNKNMSLKFYEENFYNWINIVLKSMNVKIKVKDFNIENFIKCNCDYKFTYQTSKNDFALTCKESNQNIINIINDHIYCLINNKKFINATVSSSGYIIWSSSRFKRLT